MTKFQAMKSVGYSFFPNERGVVLHMASLITLQNKIGRSWGLLKSQTAHPTITINVKTTTYEPRLRNALGRRHADAIFPEYWAKRKQPGKTFSSKLWCITRL